MNILVDNTVKFSRKNRRNIAKNFKTKNVNVKVIPTKVEKRRKSGKTKR